MKNKQDLLAKSGVKSKFKFQVNVSRLPRKPREIRVLDEKLLADIKILTSTKLSYRGVCSDDDVVFSYLNNSYSNLYTLYSNMSDFLGYEDLKTKYWFSDSETFGYIHEVCSVKACPDFKLKLRDSLDYTSVDILQGMLTEYMKNRGAKRISKKKYFSTCEWFIVYLNKMVRYKKYGITYTRISNFKSDHNVSNKDFSIPICLNLISMLEEYNLVISFTGNRLFGGSCMSMVIPSPELLSMLDITGNDYISHNTPDKLLIVKDKEGNEVELISEDAISKVKQNESYLVDYSKMMGSKLVTINGYGIPSYWIKRSLYIEDEINSRFFDDGSVQGKSKHIRSLVKIDQEETVSLDFKSIHPAILLEWENCSIKEHDPYPSFKDIKVDIKLINRFKSYYNLDKYDPVRNIVKKLFLCMINASSIGNAVGVCYDMLKTDNLKKGTYRESTMMFVGLPSINLHEVANRLLEHNHMISQWLGVGIGNKLQYKDSLIIEHCLKTLVPLDIPFLPVHDAIICKKSDMVIVEETMMEGFVNVVGEGSERNCVIEEE